MNHGEQAMNQPSADSFDWQRYHMLDAARSDGDLSESGAAKLAELEKQLATMPEYGYLLDFDAFDLYRK
jgi:hypothetical protein